MRDHCKPSKRMHFVLRTPSLHHIALVKIVSHLWKQRDIVTLVLDSECYLHRGTTSENSKEWKEIRDKVIGKVSQLPLPEQCKLFVINFVEPLGIEIANWCWDFSFPLEVDDNAFVKCLLELLCWTVHGTVNYKKMAELLVKDERLDVLDRYKFACTNCMEDEILRLNTFITEDQRNELFQRDRCFGAGELYPVPDWEIFWTAFVNGVHLNWLNGFIREYGAPGDSFYQYLFKSALHCNKRTACEYLFDKFSQKERDQILEQCSHFSFKRVNLIFDLLPRMNEEQQGRIFRCDFPYVLQHLLSWPRQSLFLENAKSGWSLLSCDGYARLLGAVTDKILRGFNDYNYSELFREFWRSSPTGYNEYYLDNDFYMNLFLSKKENMIKLLLDEASSLQLEWVFSYRNQVARNILINEGVVSDQTMNECKGKIELDLVNAGDGAGADRAKYENVLRLAKEIIESRMKGKLFGERCEVRRIIKKAKVI